MRSHLISARFAGRCRQCGKAVHPGEQVWFAKHYGVRCADCGAHGADDQPLTKSRYKGHRSRPDGARPKTSSSTSKPLDVTDPKSRAATRCGDGIHRIEFGSVTEAVQDALCDYAQNDSSRELIRAKLDAALSGASKWGNHFTRERLLSELDNPAQSLLDAVDQMRQLLIDDLDLPTTPRRKVRHGLDHGDELDADRWLNREPDAWDRSVREPQARRTVTIGCNLSVNCNATPEQLLYRGAAALALADVLNQRGCNVTIIAFSTVADPSTHVDRVVTKYTVKESSMPLDVSAVAFSLCEIAFFRVVAALGQCRHLPGKVSRTLGRATRVPTPDREGIDYLIDADCLSREAAEAWLKSQLESEACHV